MPMKKLKEETELFYSFLRQNGLKKTYQKDLILETFLNTEGHLSVEDIYALVKKKDKKVGVVTVFRTLKSLTACGIAREISLGDGLTRFEHCYHHPYHHHIVCTECQKTIEFVSPDLEQIQNEIIKKYHFKPVNNQFHTYGICKDCLEKKPVSDKLDFDTEKIFARDALKMALSMESRCLAFYKESAQRNQDPAGKETFKAMILEEEKHIADLNAKLDELMQQEKDLDKAPVFLHFNLNVLDAMIPDLSKYNDDREINLDSKAAIEVSSKLNRSTAEFFRKLAEKFTDTMGKRIFMNFAVQEENHSILMRQRMESLLQSSIQ